MASILQGSRSVLALAAASLCACGGLGTPAPIVGALSGRVIGATEGGYAYPLGRPDLVVPLAVDGAGVGTYLVVDVPVSVDALVLYDGADRAELITVAVAAGGQVQLADRYGAGATGSPALMMPLAGSVLAAVEPSGGALAWRPAFSVRGTILGVQPPSGGVDTLFPLPPGTFTLDAALPGFLPGSGTVTVAGGATSAVQLKLAIDTAGGAPGCASAPACETGLACDPLDGRCKACTEADATACLASTTCDAAAGLCAATRAGAVPLCSSCAKDADCGVGVCVVPFGATSGYCSRTCLVDADCPAGFDCGDVSHRCKAPTGCNPWLRTMGAECLSSSRCWSDLDWGTCANAAGAAGYCTSRCRTNSDCRIGGGIAATMTCVGGYCALP